MKDNNLLKISFICSLLGILILYTLSQNISVEEKTINKITIGDLDNKVKIKGLVDNIIDTESVLILDVAQAQNMKVILFKENNQSIDIKKEDLIEVIGQVEEYNGELEIIGQRVRIIR